MKLTITAVPALQVIGVPWRDRALRRVTAPTRRSRIEVLGDRIAFWECPDAFNAILVDVPASVPK